MIKDLKGKLNKICSLPRPTRQEVSNILKQCFDEGKEYQRKKNYKLIKIQPWTTNKQA